MSISSLSVSEFRNEFFPSASDAYEDSYSFHKESVEHSDTPPHCPFFLDPTHFHRKDSLDRVMEIVHDFCKQVNADFIYEHSFALQCSVYKHYSEGKFQINVFTGRDGACTNCSVHVDSEYPFVIEIKYISGDAFVFMDVMTKIRVVLATDFSELASEIVSELESDIASEIAYGPPSTEQLSESLENIFYASLSPFCDVRSEALSALAELTLHDAVKEMCTARVEQVEGLVPLLRSRYPGVARCASSVVVNLLESKSHQFLFAIVLLSAGCLEALHDLMASAPESSTRPEILRECKKALCFLEKLSDS